MSNTMLSLLMKIYPCHERQGHTRNVPLTVGTFRSLSIESRENLTDHDHAISHVQRDMIRIAGVVGGRI